MDQTPNPTPPPRYEEAIKSTSSSTPAMNDPTNTKTPDLFSTRSGDHWMDGHAKLTSLPEKYLRPWPDCIPIEKLSLENMPPFYRRLQDDQVGHLVQWVGSPLTSLTASKLKEYWPWDFNKTGKILNNRDNWGPAYSDHRVKKLQDSLPGGHGVPLYVDPGMRPTGTSSGRDMELEPRESGSKKKRKAEAMASGDVEGIRKKSRLGDGHLRDEVIQSLIRKIDDVVAQKQQLKEKDEERERRVSEAESQFKAKDVEAAETRVLLEEAHSNLDITKEEYKTLTAEHDEALEEHERLKRIIKHLSLRSREAIRRVRSLSMDVTKYKVGDKELDKYKARIYEAELQLNANANQMARMRSFWAAAQEAHEKLSSEINKPKKMSTSTGACEI